MKGSPQGCLPLQDVINFMSINVGRGGTTQDIALSRACDLRIDVLLIQEPWWSNCTKTHPYYELYLPFGGENIRPRAATYIRKDPKRITSIQKYPPSPTGDYCWVEVNEIMFLNVYKAPHDPTAVQPLLRWTPTSRSIAIGDFNSVYWAWQPSASSYYGQGEEIEKWAEEHKLNCLIVGEPTHRAGNTLDLAFTNISETMAWVSTEECMTSDHLPICGFVPNHKVSTANLSTLNGKIRVSKANLPQFARVVTHWLPTLRLINTIEEIDKFAQDLSWALESALNAVGKRPNKKSGRSAPWWTTECKSANLEYREATEVSERNKKAKMFRATVAYAKREHWKSRIEGMGSSQDVYKLMRWGSSRNASITPPLRYEGRFISDQAERARVLRDSLLARLSASDDLLPCTLTGEESIPWSEDVSEHEVRACTIDCGNTSPGADGISVELLAACWNNLGPHVTQLFRACLRLGYHPVCFRLAEVVFLPKPRRDPSSVKGWRPISLLSCLGKGLERLLAKRMSHLAVTWDIVGRQQFGALPKRSATDLVSCVVHDIEEAKTQGWASTFVTLDVQGAFDAVLHNRLIWRMESQGWPKSVLRWTSSFLTNRRVQVRFQGGVTSPKELVCGVPQGSPISPLLFLLYMA